MCYGERHARHRGAKMTGAEHPSDQSADGIRPEDDSQVSDSAGKRTSLWTATGSSQQAGCVQSVSGRTIESRSLECAGAAAELRARGYLRGYTILKDWLQPQRESACTVAVRRFETPPGKQAQVDWGHLGTIEMDGRLRTLNGFAFTLGYSRTMMAEAGVGPEVGHVAKDA